MKIIINLLVLICACYAQNESKLPTRTLSIEGKQIVVEIADQEHTRAQGLMHRQKLGRNEGMLFVFPEPQPVAFWMRNTRIPLSVAYIDANGKILEIHPLTPYEEKNVPSQSNEIKYALEMNRDWFANNQIKSGSKILGLR